MSHIDSFAPFSIAEEWDNSGLIVGAESASVLKIGVTLDAIPEAVISASEQGCNVLVCHHPLIFRAIKRIDTGEYIGRTIAEAIKRNMSIIAAHTNWDKAPGGVNDTLASLIGLKNITPLGDFGLVGELPGIMTVKALYEHVMLSWHLSRLDVYAKYLLDKVSRVALCGGSGSEFWRQAATMDADIYITADMKYHELIDATRSGLFIALSEHGEMERASLPELARKIALCGIETVMIGTKALAKPLRL